MINLYHHFYKNYYEGFDRVRVELRDNNYKNIVGWNHLGKNEDDRNKKAIASFFDKKNEVLFEANLPDEKGIQSLNEFYLKTTYPGLLMGSGYTRGIGAVGEFKLGFHLDYTTGLPIIPGTGVKGALRSVFPDIVPVFEDNKLVRFNFGKTKRIQIVNEAKCKWLLAQINSINEEDFLVKDYDASEEDLTLEQLTKIYYLTQEVFEGVDWDESSHSQQVKKSIYKRDVFHDAYPDMRHNHRPIFADDSITPHKKKDVSHELSALTNPVPLLFLKIRPNIQFRFAFDLKDGILNANDKQLLFQKILLEWGIGAKTNVGYGQFEAGSDEERDTTDFNNNDNKTATFFDREAYTIIKDTSFKKNQEITAEVIDIIDGYYILEFGDNQYPINGASIEKKAEKREKQNKPHKYTTPEIGDEVKLLVNNINPFEFSMKINWQKS